MSGGGVRVYLCVNESVREEITVLINSHQHSILTDISDICSTLMSR